MDEVVLKRWERENEGFVLRSGSLYSIAKENSPRRSIQPSFSFLIGF
jgi:hypothetical protein